MGIERARPFRASCTLSFTQFLLLFGNQLYVAAKNIHPLTRQEFALRKLRISRVFFKFHGGLKLSNKRSNDGLRFPPQLRRTQKKELFSFLAIFAKNTGHRVTKFYPISRINITYKFYFKLFSLTQNFFEFLYIYTLLWVH